MVLYILWLLILLVNYMVMLLVGLCATGIVKLYYTCDSFRGASDVWYSHCLNGPELTIFELTISDLHNKVVCFEVKSLFTSIPLQLTLDCAENAINNSTVEFPLPRVNIMDLLNLFFTLMYFQYNGKHYKQLHSTAMDSGLLRQWLYHTSEAPLKLSHV